MMCMCVRRRCISQESAGCGRTQCRGHGEGYEVSQELPSGDADVEVLMLKGSCQPSFRVAINSKSTFRYLAGGGEICMKLCICLEFHGSHG